MERLLFVSSDLGPLNAKEIFLRETVVYLVSVKSVGRRNTNSKLGQMLNLF